MIFTEGTTVNMADIPLQYRQFIFEQRADDLNDRCYNVAREIIIEALAKNDGVKYYSFLECSREYVHRPDDSYLVSNT